MKYSYTLRGTAPIVYFVIDRRTRRHYAFYDRTIAYNEAERMNQAHPGRYEVRAKEQRSVRAAELSKK